MEIRNDESGIMNGEGMVDVAEVSAGRLCVELVARLGGVVELTGAEVLGLRDRGELRVTGVPGRGVVRYELVQKDGRGGKDGMGRRTPGRAVRRGVEREFIASEEGAKDNGKGGSEE